VAGFLYAELALLILILIPHISNKFWNTILKINFLRKLERQFIYYFYCLVGILVLCFLDSMREMAKYSSREDFAKEHGMRTLQMQMQQQMKMFRAQRNFYIVGFALFLALVIKRSLELILANYSLEVEKSAVITQAKNASNAADEEFCSFSKSEEIKRLKEKIENARNETKASNMKVDEMKLKATKLSKDYERRRTDLSSFESKRKKRIINQKLK